MRKLLQLNVTANWGSTGKIAEAIGIEAQKRGWVSAIAFGRHINPSMNRVIRVGNMPEVYAHFGLCRFFNAEGLGSVSPTKSLIKKIKDYKPDVVNLHDIHDHWLNYPLLFKYLAKTDIHVVWTFHDCWAFTGGCYHFEGYDCYKWRSGCKGDCTFSKGSFLNRVARNFALRKKYLEAIGDRLTVVCVSDWLASYTKESFLGNFCKRILTLHNGIDVDNVFVTKPGVEKENYILGVSNVWPDYKGLDDFIKLRELLPKSLGIVLVGLTESQIAKLPEGIKGIRRTQNAEELADLYRKAKVFVNPSRLDSFPTVNLEALACGTPVVTYRTGGSPEAIDCNTGIVVDKGDIVALKSAIINVINNIGLYNPDNCRERAVTCFDNKKQFIKYVDLYESLIGEDFVFGGINLNFKR